MYRTYEIATLGRLRPSNDLYLFLIVFSWVMLCLQVGKHLQLLVSLTLGLRDFRSFSSVRRKLPFLFTRGIATLKD